ncbi:Uncharacterised protein [uncultured archaeon]|nr:Uncharacterised protein [uncultured archaeon]
MGLALFILVPCIQRYSLYHLRIVPIFCVMADGSGVRIIEI